MAWDRRGIAWGRWGMAWKPTKRPARLVVTAAPFFSGRYYIFRPLIICVCVTYFFGIFFLPVILQVII